MERRLTDPERRALLELARSTLEARLEGRALPSPGHASGTLTEKAGVFVTLTEPGHVLRGCIGSLVGVEALWRSVRSNAVAAALHDSRFEPVSRAELDRLTIEISVLSPFSTVSSPDEVVVGRHGVLVERNGRRGLLLPQVPVELGWDRETFLEHTCRKAGLPADDWRDPRTRIEIFSAEVFSEDDPSGSAPA